jgi:predicted Zn-dependent protease
MKKHITVIVIIVLLTISIQSDFPQGKAISNPPVSSSISREWGTRNYYYNRYDEKADESTRTYDRISRENIFREEEDSYVYRKNGDNRDYRQNRNEISRSHIHWNSNDYPLKVYVLRTNSRYFKSIYKKYIDYAFRVWGKADSRVKFVYVSSASDADITFSFEDNLVEKYDENFLGLTNFEFGDNNNLILSDIQIGMHSTDGEKLTDGVVKSTIIHELGHAIGLDHTNNKRDIMYPYINPDSSPNMDFGDLSNGDINSVKSIVSLGFRNLYTRK